LFISILNFQSPYKYGRSQIASNTGIDFQKGGTKTENQKPLNTTSTTFLCTLNIYLELLLEEEDERFRYTIILRNRIIRYLLKYGNVKKIEKDNCVIYAELPQIPGTLVFYRKSSEREENYER
jgi:hypothetical protein